MRDGPFIVSAGTQVVARVETARDTDGPAPASLRQRPAGAVGVIVESPSDRMHAYVIRFVDGGIAHLRRHEFAVRKAFQAEGIGAGGSEVDAFAEFEPFVILRVVVGSQAFGLATDGSDTDRRGVFLPPAARTWSLVGVPEQIERESTQEAFWELGKMLVPALPVGGISGQTIATVQAAGLTSPERRRGPSEQPPCPGSSTTSSRALAGAWDWRPRR